MKPGPPRKPQRFHVLRGVPGHHRPLNKDEPKVELEIPPPPEWLSDYGRQEWDRVTPLLARARIISALDVAILIGYCETFGTYRRSVEMLNAEPSLVVTLYTKKGEPYQVPNLLLSISNKALRAMHSCLAELGMTPSARSSIIAGKGRGSDDGWDELFS